MRSSLKKITHLQPAHSVFIPDDFIQPYWPVFFNPDLMEMHKDVDMAILTLAKGGTIRQSWEPCQKIIYSQWKYTKWLQVLNLKRCPSAIWKVKCIRVVYQKLQTGQSKHLLLLEKGQSRPSGAMWHCAATQPAHIITEVQHTQPDIIWSDTHWCNWSPFSSLTSQFLQNCTRCTAGLARQKPWAYLVILFGYVKWTG